MNKRTLISNRCTLVVLTALCLGSACKSSPSMPDGNYVQAEPVSEGDEKPVPRERVVGVPYPQPVAGQARPLPPQGPSEQEVEQARSSAIENPQATLDEANQRARQAPLPEGFYGATQVYDYMPGALYQIWGAPNHLTAISFGAGEEINSFGAGDTVRWMVEKTESGQGKGRQELLLVQPRRRDLHTTMVVTTNVGTYHFELRSFQHSYMAGVAFNYPRKKLVELSKQASITNTSEEARAAKEDASLAVSLDKVVDRYQFIVEDRRDPPEWLPQRVFHDGQRTFIDFGHKLGEREVPALFVLSKSKKPRLVQYSVRGRYMIVGQVIEHALLRLGKEEDGETVGLELMKEERR